MILKLTLAYCTIIIALPPTFNFTIVIYTHCTAHRAEKKRSKEEEASVGKELGMILMMDRWMTKKFTEIL